jgi:hypothetical protein
MAIKLTPMEKALNGRTHFVYHGILADHMDPVKIEILKCTLWITLAQIPVTANDCEDVDRTEVQG